MDLLHWKDNNKYSNPEYLSDGKEKEKSSILWRWRTKSFPLKEIKDSSFMSLERLKLLLSTTTILSTSREIMKK